ncbi:MAG: SAM-dependent methyltransferase [Clostridia bacterium]|nr:SAM-dependent methyltransferase [Clostridia bacterium]
MGSGNNENGHDINEIIDEIFLAGPVRIIISKPADKEAEFRKVTITAKKSGYQIEKLTQKQAFHENVLFAQADILKKRCAEWLTGEYAQLNAWSEGQEFAVMVSKKGRVSMTRKRTKDFRPEKITAEHNRKKEYIFNEGDYIEPMVDMGILTKEGKIVRSMYDKFKQINRFAEIIDDVIKDKNYKHLNIVDFGCGKSYLTFILYYYFTEVKKLDITMTGLDLKADVIEKCNAAAKKYGYDRLKFEVGDINGYKSDTPVNMVITLHACDTATDYALFNAINWDADMIFSVPCCQHELNKQMESEKYSILTKYGLVRERTAALMTDAIRGSLLEYCGYKTQLMEFVDFAHTPKNILIRAEKTGVRRSESLEEVERLIDEFKFEPTLYRLLCEDGRI